VVKEKSRGTTGTVTREICLTTVRVKNPDKKIGYLRLLSGNNRNAVCSGPVMALADMTGKSAQILYAGQLIRFNNKVIIAEPMKFCEPRGHLF
jgi:hypothetical protein